MNLARVVVLAGPSGAGKSHLAERLGLPVLRLDDFYRDGDDPALPRIDLAGGDPIVDWDDPASWDVSAVCASLEQLCREGRAQVPTYDIATSRRTGHRVLDLDGAAFVLAEGIFAQEIVAECERRDLLALAVCVTQHPVLTFVRRLGRDLREQRKPPMVLLRRGLHLMLVQRAVVERAARLGCRVMSPDMATRAVRELG